jgi:xanthine dehydrogenase accessory factor
MVVGRDGTVGTVGGGSVEHDIIGRTRSGDTGLVRWDHADPANDSLCSGVQTMVLRRLTPDDREVLGRVAEVIGRGGYGSLGLSPGALQFREGECTPTSVEDGPHDWTAQVPTGLADTLYLAGGGHVSLAVSRVVATLPFRIIVLDDREGLATMAANRWAHDRRVIRWRDVASAIEPGMRSWAIVMTAAHSRDRQVLSRLLPLELRYLGMLGSRHKVREVFDALTADGADPARLQRVRAPVGLDIGSHTPAEIAVAIAGELVRERNRPTSGITTPPAPAPPQPR